MRTLAIILFTGGLVLEGIAIAMFDYESLATLSDIFKNSEGLGFLGIHALASLLFGFGSGGLLAAGRRAALASSLLYITFALMFPLFGMLGAVGMIWMLKKGPRTDRVQDEFVVGNPMIERWANRPTDKDLEVHTETLCSYMRSLDRDGLAGMILGLRDLLPSERAHGLLERYQQDKNSQVQFYAQSALSWEIDRVESHLAVLGQRVKLDEEKAAPRTALAEMLIGLASQRSTSAADRDIHADHALYHIDKALDEEPEFAYLYFLQARAALLVRDVEKAGKALNALETLKAPSCMTQRIRAKIAFEERDWDTLAAMPPSNDPEISPCLKYWQNA